MQIHGKALRLLAILGIVAGGPGAKQAYAGESPPVAPEQIISALSHEDGEVRADAAKQAARQGDVRLLGALVRALSDIEQEVRERAAAGIRSIPDRKADEAAIDALDHPDPMVRQELVTRFVDHPVPSAIEALAARLDDVDSTVRLQAALAIRRIPGEAATAVLTAALEHADPKVRYQAVFRLEEHPAKNRLRALVARLDDNDTQIRFRAAHAMRTLPGEAADDAMLEALGHPDPRVRDQAVHRFRVSPQAKAFESLLAALSDRDTSVRFHAAKALAKMDDPRANAALQSNEKRGQGDESIEWPGASSNKLADLGAWAKALRHGDAKVRLEAIRSIGRDSGEAAVRAALAAFGHPDPAVREEAVSRFYDHPDLRAVEALVAALDDTDSSVRAKAARALTRAAGEQATEAALEALGHWDAAVRSNIAHRFYEKPDPRAGAALAAALDDPDSDVRRNASQALGQAPGEVAAKAALAAIDHPDPAVRFQAVCRFLEKPDPRATEALVTALDDIDNGVRRAAAQALSTMAGPMPTDAMAAALGHPDPVVRTNAAFRFIKRPDPRALEALAAALDDMFAGVRQNAARALVQIPGDEAAVAVLGAIGHADPLVRRSLVHRFFEKPDARAVEALQAALADKDLSVRRVAVQALSRCVGFEAAAQFFALLDDEDLQLRKFAAASLRTLQARLAAEGIPRNQLSFGIERTLGELLTGPVSTAGVPGGFVEMVAGDRLACRVVGYSRGNDFSAVRVPPHLIVQPYGTSALRDSTSARSLSGSVRISTRWLRRVVWQRESVDRYAPGTLLLRDGGHLRFRSLRWDEAAVVVLTIDGIRRIDFQQIASLHLPEIDPWDAYFEQLAILGCDETTRLLRLDDATGSRVTVSVARFLPFHDISAADPRCWAHAVQPAWSFDALAVRHRGLSLRSSLPVEEVRLFVPESVFLPRPVLWPWQLDRGVRGQVLQSGGRKYRWGFGVHADCTLQFSVPPCTRGFRTRLGLDHTVAGGGCARGLVRVRGENETKTLYRSPLLLGSEAVLDTGNLELPSAENETRLELVADSAHHDRPEGADPLSVRDMVDWLEPRLYLDKPRLREAVSRRVPRLIPAWNGWRLEHGEGERLRLTSQWEPTGDGRVGFRSLLLVERAPVILLRSIVVKDRTDRLVLDVRRGNDTPRFCRLEVRIDGQSAGVFDVRPRVQLQGAAEPGDALEPNRPIVVSLKPYRGREVTVEIVHLDGASDSPIDWQAIRIAADRT